MILAIEAAKFAPPETRPVRIATPALAEKLTRYAKLGEKIAKLEAEREELKLALIEKGLDGSRLALGPEKAAPYGQVQRAGGGDRIDLELLRERFPAVADACTVPMPCTLTFRTYRF